MTTAPCPGIGRKWQPHAGTPGCPVCHRKWRSITPRLTKLVPAHERRVAGKD